MSIPFFRYSPCICEEPVGLKTIYKFSARVYLSVSTAAKVSFFSLIAKNGHTPKNCVCPQKSMLRYPLKQSFSECLASRNRLVVRRLVADDKVTGEYRAVIFAGFLPITHPLAVSPAIRAKQRNFDTGKLCFTGSKPWGRIHCPRALRHPLMGSRTLWRRRNRS